MITKSMISIFAFAISLTAMPHMALAKSAETQTTPPERIACDKQKTPYCIDQLRFAYEDPLLSFQYDMPVTITENSQLYEFLDDDRKQMLENATDWSRQGIVMSRKRDKGEGEMDGELPEDGADMPPPADDTKSDAGHDGARGGKHVKGQKGSRTLPLHIMEKVAKDRPQHDHDMTWELTADNGDFLNILGSLYQFTGGAHGNVHYRNIIWDKSGGEVATLASIFGNNMVLNDLLEDPICLQINKMRAKKRELPEDLPENEVYVFGSCPLLSEIALSFQQEQPFDNGKITHITVSVSPYIASHILRAAIFSTCLCQKKWWRPFAPIGGGILPLLLTKT